MHMQPDWHSRKQASTQFDNIRVNVGCCTGNEQLGFVAAVNVGRDPDGCAVTMRWQDLKAVIAAMMAGFGGRYCGYDGRIRRPLLRL